MRYKWLCLGIALSATMPLLAGGCGSAFESGGPGGDDGSASGDDGTSGDGSSNGDDGGLHHPGDDGGALDGQKPDTFVPCGAGACVEPPPAGWEGPVELYEGPAAAPACGAGFAVAVT